MCRILSILYPLKFLQEVLDVINNVLDESNMEGWQELQEVGAAQI